MGRHQKFLLREIKVLESRAPVIYGNIVPPVRLAAYWWFKWKNIAHDYNEQFEDNLLSPFQEKNLSGQKKISSSYHYYTRWSVNTQRRNILKIIPVFGVFSRGVSDLVKVGSNNSSTASNAAILFCLRFQDSRNSKSSKKNSNFFKVPKYEEKKKKKPQVWEYNWSN